MSPHSVQWALLGSGTWSCACQPIWFRPRRPQEDTKTRITLAGHFEEERPRLPLKFERDPSASENLRGGTWITSENLKDGA